MFTVVLIGDSYLTACGINSPDKFKDRIQSMLATDGLKVGIIDPGPNETSASTDARLNALFTVPQYFPAATVPVVILEKGSNDCYRSTALQTRASLSHILATFAEKHIPVLVVGTTPYQGCQSAAEPNCNAEYIRMFADLAAQYCELDYADFKQGVSGHPKLLQDDNDHPNALGEPLVKALVARTQKP